jgi:hypothetical protein
VRLAALPKRHHALHLQVPGQQSSPAPYIHGEQQQLLVSRSRTLHDAHDLRHIANSTSVLKQLD